MLFNGPSIFLLFFDCFNKKVVTNMASSTTAPAADILTISGSVVFVYDDDDSEQDVLQSPTVFGRDDSFVQDDACRQPKNRRFSTSFRNFTRPHRRLQRSKSSEAITKRPVPRKTVSLKRLASFHRSGKNSDEPRSPVSIDDTVSLDTTSLSMIQHHIDESETSLYIEDELPVCGKNS